MTVSFRTSGADRFGQTITHQCQVEISDANDATRLRLFAETATLKVGKDTTVRLHSRLEKGLALVTFEGETILRHRIIVLKKDDNEIPVQVGHDLFPNFRLAVAALDGRELRAATKDFNVERELKVTVKPLKAAFLPGEAGQVELTVTDQTGQPVEAELSLALVNEALFAVCPDSLMPILDFFQKDARRHAEFKVGATCAFRYPGQTRPVSRDVVAEAGRVVRGLAEAKQLDGLRQQMAENRPHPAAAPAGGMGGGVAGRRFRSLADPEHNGDVALGVEALTEAGGLITLNYSDAAPDSRSAGDQMLARFDGALAKDKAEAAPRREVRGAGRWLPSVVTKADGKAVANVPMPETTTTWRLTARGCTVETSSAKPPPKR